jgi:CheY-like chemotaxis protein
VGIWTALVTIVTVTVAVLALPFTGSWHPHPRGRRDPGTEPALAAEGAADPEADSAELARLKQQFLTAIHHEIRTPMNGVLGMAELLLNSGLTAEQVELVETLSESGLRLMATINDLLERTEVAVNTIDLREQVTGLGSEPVLLVVELDENIRDDVELLLEQVGCIVHAAATGAEALELLDAVAFDAIVMDYESLETTWLIRQLDQHAHDIPIIALAASEGESRDAVAQRGSQSADVGMTDYLVKPSSRPDLIASLRRHGLQIGLESAET